MKLYGIVGAGGFGREVIPLVEMMLSKQFTADTYQIVFVDQRLYGQRLNHYLVLSMDEFFSHPATDKYFNIAIANYEIRRKIAFLMLEKGIKSFRIDANNSVDLGNNQIDEGAIFCPFTTVTSNATIGKFFHANIYSYVAHDCVIGNYVTFATNVHCNGSVIIEDDVYVGTGVIIRQGTQEKPIIIGKGAILGMGSVITKSVPAYETVIGNPARPLVRSDKIKQSNLHSTVTDNQ